MSSSNDQTKIVELVHAASGIQRLVMFLLVAIIAVAVGILAFASGRWAWMVASTPPPQPPPRRMLSVDETVGVVFHGLIHNDDFPGGILLNANSEATQIIIKILQNPGLRFYYTDAALVLGYVGDASTVLWIDQEVRQRCRTYQPEEFGEVLSLINALGVMSRNGVEPAADCLRRMTTETYWNENKPIVYAPSQGGAITSSEVMKRAAILSYALSNRPDIDSVVEEAAREIPDPKRRFYFEQGVTKKQLQSAQRALARRETRTNPISEEYFQALCESWNRVPSNPLPTTPRTETPWED